MPDAYPDDHEHQDDDPASVRMRHLAMDRADDREHQAPDDELPAVPDEAYTAARHAAARARSRATLVGDQLADVEHTIRLAADAAVRAVWPLAYTAGQRDTEAIRYLIRERNSLALRCATRFAETAALRTERDELITALADCVTRAAGHAAAQPSATHTAEQDTAQSEGSTETQTDAEPLTTYCRNDPTSQVSHMCCPDDCELLTTPIGAPLYAHSNPEPEPGDAQEPPGGPGSSTRAGEQADHG